MRPSGNTGRPTMFSVVTGLVTMFFRLWQPRHWFPMMIHARPAADRASENSLEAGGNQQEQTRLGKIWT